MPFSTSHLSVSLVCMEIDVVTLRVMLRVLNFEATDVDLKVIYEENHNQSEHEKGSF